MRKFSTRKVLSVIAFIFLLTSCTTSTDIGGRLDDLLQGQVIVLPIGRDSVSLGDLLDKINSDRVGESGKDVYLKYNDTIDWQYEPINLFSNVTEMTEIFPQMPPPIGWTSTFPAGVQVSESYNYDIPLNFTSVGGVNALDSAVFNSATFEITLEKEGFGALQPSDIKIVAKFPTAFFDIDVPGDSVIHTPGAFGVAETKTIPGLTVHFVSGNTITIPVKLYIKPSSTIIINSTSKLTFRYKLVGADAKIYYGRFSPAIQIGAQEKEYDLSEFVNEIPDDGIIKATEPEIKLSVLNHSGVGVNMVVDSVKAYKSADPAFLPVYALFNGNKGKTIPVSRKINITDNAPETVMTLDNTTENGDIDRFLNKFPLPDKLYYKFHITSSYKTGDPIEFFTPSDKVEGRLAVKIPLKFDAGSAYTFTDTIKDVSFDGLTDPDMLDNVFFAFKVINKFPLKGKLSVEFLDDAGNKIPGFEKLLSDSVITAPAVDSQGDVVENAFSESNLILTVDNQLLNKLSFVKNIKYSIHIESDENRKIIFRKDNKLIIKLGVYLKGNKLFKD